MIKGYRKSRRFGRKRKFTGASRTSKRLRLGRAKRQKTSARLGQGFPKRVTMTHKYCDIVTVTSTTGALGTYRFRCNGMFDPDYTSTGHQPMYFDQMSAIYDHFTVIGSKIKIKVTPQTTISAASYVGMFINDDTSSTNITGIPALMEQPTGVVKQIPVAVSNPVYMTKSWSAKKFFPGSTMANVNLSGTPTSDPSEQSIYEICCQCSNNATGTFQVEVEISYIAVWSEVKDLAQS